MKTLITCVLTAFLSFTPIALADDSIVFELTGLVIPKAKLVKPIRAACILNDRIFYEGDMVELKAGKLGAKVVEGGRVKIQYPVVVVQEIKKGKVVVLILNSNKDGDGDSVIVRMKKRPAVY